jgi:hypothetical protein
MLVHSVSKLFLAANLLLRGVYKNSEVQQSLKVALYYFPHRGVPIYKFLLHIAAVKTRHGRALHIPLTVVRAVGIHLKALETFP